MSRVKFLRRGYCFCSANTIEKLLESLLLPYTRSLFGRLSVTIKFNSVCSKAASVTYSSRNTRGVAFSIFSRKNAGEDLKCWRQLTMFGAIANLFWGRFCLYFRKWFQKQIWTLQTEFSWNMVTQLGPSILKVLGYWIPRSGNPWDNIIFVEDFFQWIFKVFKCENTIKFRLSIHFCSKKCTRWSGVNLRIENIHKNHWWNLGLCGGKWVKKGFPLLWFNSSDSDVRVSVSRHCLGGKGLSRCHVVGTWNACQLY